jgi:hypothetical protein
LDWLPLQNADREFRIASSVIDGDERRAKWASK